MTHRSAIVRFLRDKVEGLKDTDRVVISALGIKAIIGELDSGAWPDSNIRPRCPNCDGGDPAGAICEHCR